MALRYLTIVPIPGGAPSREGPGASAAWFPVVGLAIGALLVLVDRATTALFAPLLAALLVVTAWKLVTGGLHLDGVADCFDGLVGHDPAHRLAIMRDSRIGVFGAVGLILFLLLEVAAVSGIDARARWRALLVAPVVGRAMPPLLARMFAAAPSGHGARFRAELGPARRALLERPGACATQRRAAWRLPGAGAGAGSGAARDGHGAMGRSDGGGDPGPRAASVCDMDGERRRVSVSRGRERARPRRARM